MFIIKIVNGFNEIKGVAMNRPGRQLERYMCDKDKKPTIGNRLRRQIMDAKKLVMRRSPIENVRIGLKYIGLIIVLSTVMLACSGNITYFKPSWDVSRMFENGNVLPDHKYYVGGPVSKPNAVVAILKEYTLESDSWKEISVDQASLADLIKRVGFVPGAKEKSRRLPNGARIVSPDGTPVGIWYSVYDYSIVFIDGKRISLTYPPSTLPAGISTEGAHS
jgi:hypothetical protein